MYINYIILPIFSDLDPQEIERSSKEADSVITILKYNIDVPVCIQYIQNWAKDHLAVQNFKNVKHRFCVKGVLISKEISWKKHQLELLTDVTYNHPVVKQLRSYKNHIIPLIRYIARLLHEIYRKCVEALYPKDVNFVHALNQDRIVKLKMELTELHHRLVNLQQQNQLARSLVDFVEGDPTRRFELLNPRARSVISMCAMEIRNQYALLHLRQADPAT